MWRRLGRVKDTNPEPKKKSWSGEILYYLFSNNAESIPRSSARTQWENAARAASRLPIN